jgi:hypothetical protein
MILKKQTCMLPLLLCAAATILHRFLWKDLDLSTITACHHIAQFMIVRAYRD